MLTTKPQALVPAAKALEAGSRMEDFTKSGVHLHAMLGAQVGAYRILQQIGEGGMGTVWLAEHTVLGRRAALKMLHPAFSNRQDILTRFFNEARAAASISDPGIVQIFDFGHHVDGSAYIVMELLEGEPLDRRIARSRVSLNDALRIMRQVAGSLGTAHARGIVHRDLKPENVFLVRDAEVIGGERAKILDFGIAKLFGDSNVKTQTSAMLGTPAYMSPEQCRGAGRVDERSDIYSLGCMLFRLIAGRPPFDAEGNGEIIAMHLREPAPRLSSFVAGVPWAIDDLVQRCLEKEPGRRFASGSALAEAIRQIVVAGESSQISSSTRHVYAGGHTTLSASAVSVVKAKVPRHRSVLTIAAASAVVVSASIVAIVLHRGSDAVTSGSDAVTTPQMQPSPAGASRPPESRVASPAAQPHPAVEAPPAQRAPLSSIAERAPERGPDTPATPIAPAASTERTPPAANDRVALASTSPSPNRMRPQVASSEAPVSAARKITESGPIDKTSKPAQSAPAIPSAAAAAAAPAPSRAASSVPTDSPTDFVPEKLDKAMIAVGLEPVRQRIMACGAAFQGVRIGVSVAVSPAGEITSVTVKDSPDPWLDSCVSARMKMAHFATTQRGGAFLQRFAF